MKETWGPPPGGGWPDFCEKCGKRRKWQDIRTSDGDLYSMDFHHCEDDKEAA